MDNNNQPHARAKTGLGTVLGDFQKGFHFAASNPIFLIPPVLIDLIVWFGPRISFHDVLNEPLGALFANTLAQLPDAFRAEYAPLFSATLKGLRASNLIGTIALLPGSIPFLFSGNLPNGAPVVGIERIEIPNLSILALLVILLTAFGFIFGIFYYSMVTRRVLGLKDGLTPRRFLLQLGRFAAALAVLILIVTAVLFAVSFALLILVRLGQIFVSIFVLAATVGLLWIMLPLLFVPAGIFTDLPLGDALIVSRNIPANDLIGNAKFWTITFVIAFGLRNIWRIPESDSWMTLIGIFGSAFITLAIYAAYLYRYKSQLIGTLKIRHILSGIQAREETNGKQSNEQ